jgi:hypothetical protein
VAQEELVVKAKIFAVGLIDILIDLLLPTLVYLVLAPTGRSAAVRLTVGGFCVAAKSVAGAAYEPDLEAPAEGATPTAAGTGAVEAGEVKGRGSSGWGALLRAVLVALVASVATLIAAFAGANDTVAILIGTLFLAAALVPVLLQRPQIDGFALLVLGEVAVSVVLVLISTDPRFILVRPAFYTAIAGLWAISTCFAGKPFMMQVTRPVAAGGDPLRAAAFDRAWITSPSFRRAEQAMTLGLGVVLVLEAILRVIAVYSQPEGAVLHASLISQLPGTVLFVGYLVAIRVFIVPIASREVDKEMLTPAASAPGVQNPPLEAGETHHETHHETQGD